MKQRTLLKKIFAVSLTVGLCFSNTFSVVHAQDELPVVQESQTQDIVNEESGTTNQELNEQTNVVDSPNTFQENTNREIDVVQSDVEIQPIADQGFTWDEATKTLTVKEQILDYNKDNQEEIHAPFYDYKDLAENIIIDTDGRIGQYAFTYFTKIKNVRIINAGNISQYAFYRDSNIKSVPVTLYIEKCNDIESYAFENLGATGELVINKCSNIKMNAFGSIGLVTSLTINECNEIEKNAFNGSGFTSSLETFKLGKANELKAVFNKLYTNLKSVSLGQINGDIPSGFIATNTVEEFSVEKCENIKGQIGFSGLKILKIGECNEIEKILTSGSLANLESIEISKCNKIKYGAFQDSTKLKMVKIDECNIIESSAFQNAKALEKLELGTVNEIGLFAFNSIGEDGNLKELNITGNIKMDSYAFAYANIENLIINGDELYVIPNGAFSSSTIKNITLSNIKNLGSNSFAYLKGLETLTIENLGVIESESFKISDDNFDNELKVINLKNVNEIGDYAFQNFKSIETVNIDGSVGIIGAHAFSGCEKLETINISDTTKLGYSDVFVRQDYVRNRVNAILYGQFNLIDKSQTIETITPEGWTSSKIGINNKAESLYGDTQITKEAKWNDEEETIADVLINAYYTTNQQMDFIFVADCSNSMSGFGSSEALNSNFYNMQSKMMDVSEQLLGSTGDLDTRVAFSTFGKTENSISDFFEKGQAKEAKDYIWNKIVNYESDTNYSTGLSGALNLVEQNKGRNTTVIFISDGQPYSSEESIPESYFGVSEAQAIKDAGANLICVLQQVPESVLSSSQENMSKLSDTVFASTDLVGFSQAINDAIEYAYSTYTLTDVIDSDFELIEDSIQATDGTTYEVTKDENGNSVIKWTIIGMPFTKLSLSFQEKLKPNEDGAYPYGHFDTNDCDAILVDGSKEVNKVETPVLQRLDPNADKITLKTEKIWKNDNEKDRPESIEVTLFKDGEELDKVTLSKNNDWQYQWDNMDKNHTYVLQETKVPENYTSKITHSGQMWTITNTYSKPETPHIDKEQDKGENTGVNTGVGLFISLGTTALTGLALIETLKRKNRL